MVWITGNLVSRQTQGRDGNHPCAMEQRPGWLRSFQLRSQRRSPGIFSHTQFPFKKLRVCFPAFLQWTSGFSEGHGVEKGDLGKICGCGFPPMFNSLWVPFGRFTSSWAINFFKSATRSERYSEKVKDTARSPSRLTNWHLQVRLCTSLRLDEIFLQSVSVLNRGQLKCLLHKSCESFFFVD